MQADLDRVLLTEEQLADRVREMADLLPTTIAQGLVGYPYIAPDMVGGGEDTSLVEGFELDQENFVRWAQLSTFFPIIQYSMLPNRVLDDKHAKAQRGDEVRLAEMLGVFEIELVL